MEWDAGKGVRRHCYYLRIWGSRPKEVNGSLNKSCGSGVGRKVQTDEKTLEEMKRLSHPSEVGRRNKSRLYSR